MTKRMAYLAVTVALALSQMAAAQQNAQQGATLAYWGPVTVTIANPANYGNISTMFHVKLIYQKLDILVALGACPIIAEGIGYTWTSLGYVENPGNPRIELPGDLVYTTFINSYPGNDRWRPSEALTCYNFLYVGQRLCLDGRIIASADLFGYTWIADHMRVC